MFDSKLPSSDAQGEEKFKKGDYSVHIYIEESKGLLPTTDDRSFNPVISVKCFDKSKCTRKLKDITTGATTIWGEHLYFSKLSCTVNELESSKILIEVLDSKSFKNNLIGSYELDFTYIYFQPKHSIIHQWIILSNPYSEDITVQRGLIKVGVNVMHESDKGEDLTVKGVSDSLIIPPQVSVKSMQLVIRVLQAANLPKMDSGGTCDAYCVATFATTKNKSRVYTTDKATMSAFWFQELWIPVCQPSISNKINFTLWDSDTFGEDELIGSLNFQWEKIPYQKEALLDPTKAYFWANVYGAPEGINNEKAVEMNYNQKLASHWRGRVLMCLFKSEIDKALLKTVCIDTEENRRLVQEVYEVEDVKILLNVQVLEAVNLPNKTGHYSVSVKFSGIEMLSKPSEAAKGCCKWYENISRRTVDIPNGAILPDVFIYLMYDKQPICFARVKQSELSNPKPKETWLKLTPDSAIGKVNNVWEGGYLLVRVFIGKMDEPGYDKKFWDAKLDYAQKFTNKTPIITFLLIILSKI